MKKFLAAVVVFGAIAAPQPANALLCNALLGCSCSVNASDLAFGANINPLSTPAATAVSDVTVSCTNVIDVAPVIAVKVGAGLWGASPDRQMRDAANNRLHYNLYASTLYSTILGDGTGGLPALSISGGLITLGAWTATGHIYGRAPMTTGTRPGAYTDTVTVRIDW